MTATKEAGILNFLNFVHTPQIEDMAYDTYTSVNIVSAMILYTMYRSMSRDVEVSKSPATPRAAECVVKREAFHLGSVQIQL